MSYNFESLGPEGFQHFCQALATLEFQHVQCLPVGQRDGGRDALAYFLDGKDSYVVFQVKFVRTPQLQHDAHKWLVDIIKGEAPKVQKLIPRGAAHYVLMTNVPGTAHPDSGAIDAAHIVLSDSLGITSECWWRDDLARRVDAHPDIKWSFPALITAGELLKCLLQSRGAEHADKRTTAIRSFLRDQFQRDKEVRFKQIELHNQLLDLFIDVPLEIRSGPRKQVRRLEWDLQTLSSDDDFPDSSVGDPPAYGAATVLLNADFQSRMPKVVLEGAPGQGKSTVVQYVCQIHRRRILQEPMSVPGIPEAHRSQPVRLPFKIDLRDFSVWLRRGNPFEGAEGSVPDNWTKSLESFLATQIQHGSGGVPFGVDDLHEVCRASSVLLVFDGLDEVADIAARREVVDEVNRAINRLADVAISLQSIVTSRPAAFSHSPSFSDAHFVFCELVSITRQLIDEYAERWVRARRLQGHEAAEVRRILETKLDQPHLRELARNPMQLAILLSLIHQRGSSLPDKRTSLYDAYVDLFFSRESEKSDVVREHRDLLIDIHRYIAWTLHAQAEQASTSGSISNERLRTLVRGYLESEGYDAELADQLFSGMVERVVVLVSRVQGTFEFEVQPLREYFAARHLYETATYSPVGENRSGTLPDRFDAIARNFYWLNVARFYAGCYNKGELPSLVDRLDDLCRDDVFRLTRHPQALATTLLSDWVFAQHPKSMKAVVALLLEGIGLRHMLLATSRRARRHASPVLPKGSGNVELVEKCFAVLQEPVQRDYAEILSDVIIVNATREERKARWHPVAKAKTGACRTRWFERGMQLGVLALLNDDEVGELLQDDPGNTTRLWYLLRGGQRRYLESVPDCFTIIVDGILANAILHFPIVRPELSHLDVLAECVDVTALSVAFEHPDPLSLEEVIRRYRAYGRGDVQVDAVSGSGRYELCGLIDQVADVYAREIRRPASDWARSLEPWDELVEAVRNTFGERWAAVCIANAAAGIRNRDERCEDADDLLDNAQSLCRRMRRARVRSGSHRWYERQMRACNSLKDEKLVALTILCWAGPVTLTSLVDVVDNTLSKLPREEWSALRRALGYGTGRDASTGTVAFEREKLPSMLSPRTVVALGERADESSRWRLYDQYLSDYDGIDAHVHGFAEQVAHEMIMADTGNWERGLKMLRRSYGREHGTFRPFPYRFIRGRGIRSIPYDLAKDVVLNPTNFPSDVVAAAEARCREELAKEIVPVGIIAERDSWFNG